MKRGEFAAIDGERLQPFSDFFTGHALEFRISAEDPCTNFMPSPGAISALRLPGGPWVRVDFGFIAGNIVAPLYGSLLGKIVVWASTREVAISRGERVPDDALIEGVKTTAGMLRRLLSLDDLKQVAHRTTHIEFVPDRSKVSARHSPRHDTRGAVTNFCLSRSQKACLWRQTSSLTASRTHSARKPRRGSLTSARRTRRSSFDSIRRRAI